MKLSKNWFSPKKCSYGTYNAVLTTIPWVCHEKSKIFAQSPKFIWKKLIFLKKHKFPPNDQLDTECSHDNTLVFFPRKIWMNAAVGAGTIIKTISFSFNLVSSKCILGVKISVLSTPVFFRQKTEKFQLTFPKQNENLPFWQKQFLSECFSGHVGCIWQPCQIGFAQKAENFLFSVRKGKEKVSLFMKNIFCQKFPMEM